MTFENILYGNTIIQHVSTNNRYLRNLLVKTIIK